MHTILKFHWCRWLIFQNVVHFSTCKKSKISRNLNQTVDVKIRRNFQYFGHFYEYYVWPGWPTLYTSRKSLIKAKRLSRDNFSSRRSLSKTAKARTL